MEIKGEPIITTKIHDKVLHDIASYPFLNVANAHIMSG